MKRPGRLLLATLAQGGLFLVPLVLATVLARAGHQMMFRRLSPRLSGNSPKTVFPPSWPRTWPILHASVRGRPKPT